MRFSFPKTRDHHKAISIAVFSIGAFGGIYFFLPKLSTVEYSADLALAATTTMVKPWAATHVSTPEPLKALYLTSWVAGSKSLREPVLSLLQSTEANAVVIDIKDYTGNISFPLDDPALKGAVENRIPDIRTLIESLHEKHIYVIGRVAVFQDPFMVKHHPEVAVKRKSDPSVVWKDYKGISWIDAGSQEYWNYMITLGKAAYKEGFDEINFDYIRFPSDGDMTDVYYPVSNGMAKSEVLEHFFQYLHEGFAGTGIKISADIFGMTTTNSDDLGIGQVLEKALPYFDAIAPMVYPSHYPTGFINLKNPAAHPYEVIKFSMDHAVLRASTTPLKLRPWLQDFNLGAVYTPEMIRAEKKAVYDSGLTSWMMWNAASKYTKAALDSRVSQVTDEAAAAVAR